MAGDDITLGEVSRKLDSFAQSITSALSDLKADIRDKADRGQFDRLEGRFDSLEERTERLESWRHDKEVAANVHQQRDERTKITRRGWMAIVSGIATLGATLTLAIAAVLGVHG